jgi:uncharacterized protein YecE (DUF72 family)
MTDGKRNARHEVWIGCAGWTLPREAVAGFPGSGTHLERYARVFPAVEINTTFYRPHRPETFERWAASVPARFRFSLKTHRAVTHFRRLKNPDDLLAPFVEASARLGERRGPLVVQLPPTLRYEPAVARAFLRTLRRLHSGPVAFEPRHPSWFSPAVESLLAEFEIARVAADPPRARTDGRPGGFSGLAYFRLHGSPRMYFSAYDEQFLARLARRVQRLSRSGEVWVVFDNTATRAAVDNARTLMALVDRHRDAGSPGRR